MSMGTKVIAIYNEGVLKPIEKLNSPEKAKVRITISGNFSKLLDEVGEIEAKEEIDQVIGTCHPINSFLLIKKMLSLMTI
jgi:predicted DNA-binding antitoxin AbrB/MazE fold protein